MHVMTENTLRRIRQELGISQETLARRTKSVSLGTVKNAEIGRGTTYKNAMQLLQAINEIRSEQGLPHLRLEDLELNLF